MFGWKLRTIRNFPGRVDAAVQRKQLYMSFQELGVIWEAPMFRCFQFGKGHRDRNG